MQYTMKDVWGFTYVHAAMPEHPTNASHDYVAQFMNELNKAARDRGVKNLNQPSDSLDASRDLLLDEAANALDAEWEHKGDVLALIHRSLVGRVDWDNLLDVTEKRN